MKKLIIIYVLSLWTGSSYSQIHIKGKVMDENRQESIAYANLSLLNTDSTFLTGGSSNADGRFSLRTKPGSYLLKITYTGYRPHSIALEQLEKSIDLDTVFLEKETIRLADVTVTGSNITHKVDRMIVQPAGWQVKNSYDGYELLHQMALPRLQVDPLMKTLKMSGDRNVQIRINGIKAVSPEELSAIRSQDILRVEYLENPGSRYEDENLGAVLNIITKRKTAGGILNFQLMDSPHVLFGQNSADLKVNRKNSEWGLHYSNRNRGSNHTRYDVNEKFVFEKATVERLQEGLDDKNKSFQHHLQLSYNYYLPDKRIVNVALRNEFNSIPYDDRSSRMIEQASRFYAYIHNKNKIYSPSIDVYYKQFLKNSQSIEVNVVATYLHTDTYRAYRKNDESDPNLFASFMDVNGKKRSIIAEGIYDKAFKHAKLTAGLRHYQMNARNDYAGSEPVRSRMRQAKSALFAEVQGKYKKLDYLIGMGVTRSWFKENDEDHSYYIVNPNLRLGLSPHANGYVNYQFDIHPSIPSLSSLTAIEQAIDEIQISKGNPALKTYKTFNNLLDYSLSQKKFRENLHVGYQYFDDPIMETVWASNDHIYLMDQNQRSFQKLNLELSFTASALDLGRLKHFLTLDASVGYTRFDSKGKAYHYTYDHVYFNFMALFMYKNWMLMGQYRRYQNALWGETLKKGTDMTALMLNYRFKNMQAGVGMTYPFASKFKEGNRRLNPDAPMESWKFIGETTQMVVLRFSYNFVFGRKHKGGDKEINHSDTETGVLKTDR